MVRRGGGDMCGLMVFLDNSLLQIWCGGVLLGISGFMSVALDVFLVAFLVAR